MLIVIALKSHLTYHQLKSPIKVATKRFRIKLERFYLKCVTTVR